MKKLFIITIFLSFLLGLAYSADETNHFYLLNDFSGGLNTHIKDISIPPNQFSDCSNVRINSSYGALSKRGKMVQSFDAGSASVNGLHRYYKSDDTVYTVAATGTSLVYNNDGTATTLMSGLTDGKWWQFVTYMDKMIGMNGYDDPIKWDGATTTTTNTDGARTAGNLCAELGAPFAELNTGTDLDASKWYQYKVAFYDGSTYFYSDARSNPIQTGADVHNIYLTDIPLGPTGTTHRYIYRTEGDSSKANVEADTSFYLVAEIADNTTAVYADSESDATILVDNTPKWSTVSAGTPYTPPKGRLCTIQDERLFIGGDLTNKSYLYWSEEYLPDIFDTDTEYESIREDDGDEMTFLKTQLGILTVGKTNTIQKFYTDFASTDSWYASDPFSHIGCPAPYSAANSPIGIIYCAWNGIYAFNGQSSKLISDTVTPEIRDILASNIEDVAGFYFDNEYQMAYTSQESGATQNNRVLIYNLIRNAYVVDYKNINCFAGFTAGADQGVLYSGDSTTGGLVYAHDISNPSLIKRYKSEFNAGTFDDARVYGTENNPTVDLAWDCTIDGWLTELQTKDASITTIDSIETYLPNATIDRPDTDGSWTSEIYEISAGYLDKLYWNERLSSYGNVTFNLKTCDDAACSGDSFSATNYTDPNGSDISSETAEDYIQIKINLSTTDIAHSPELYVSDGYLFKVAYLESGSTFESDFVSTWDSGWRDFTPQQPGYKKHIQYIRVYYRGTSGDIAFNYKNDEGDIDDSFTINLAQSVPADIDNDFTNDYVGAGDLKVYTHYPPANQVGQPGAIGRLWRFEIVDEVTTTDVWHIDGVEICYWVEEMYE